MSRDSVIMPTESARSASCWSRAAISRLACLWCSRKIMTPSRLGPWSQHADQVGDLLVDVGQAGLAHRVAAGDLRVQRRAGKQPQRLDPLGQVGMRAEQLAVAAEAALAVPAGFAFGDGAQVVLGAERGA